MTRAISQPLVLLAGVAMIWVSGRMLVLGAEGATRDIARVTTPTVSDPISRMAGATTGQPIFEPVTRRSPPVQHRRSWAALAPSPPIKLRVRHGRATWPALPPVLPQDRSLAPLSGAAGQPVNPATHSVIQPALPPPVASPDPKTGRWALSSWAFVRPPLSGATRFDIATLGGSQIGVRAARGLTADGRLSLVARLASSGEIGDGLEGAVGLSVRPMARLPVDVTVERREQLAGQGGRSAFAAVVSGGVSDVAIVRGLTLDGYAAAGIVGAQRRDLFIEGSAVASHGLIGVAGANLAVGAGAWGAAQPGVARFDLGPRLSTRLPFGAVRPLLAIDWRQRIAGNAEPSSGVALTLAADF